MRFIVLGACRSQGGVVAGVGRGRGPPRPIEDVAEYQFAFPTFTEGVGQAARVRQLAQVVPILLKVPDVLVRGDPHDDELAARGTLTFAVER